MVTGAGALLGQGIIRSLRGAELEVYVAAVDPSPLAAGLYWADEAHLVPMASDSGYLDRIWELVHRIRPDAVLVGTDVELEILAEHRASLEKQLNTVVVVSPPDIIRIANDKYETYRFLREQGFGYPASALPGQEDELVAHHGFPVVVKPRMGARSVGMYVVDDWTMLRKCIASAEEPVVIQEYLGRSDEEYTAGVLVFDGLVEGTIVMRRELRDGNTYRAFVGSFPELEAQVGRLGAMLRPHGPANFQFRAVDGEVKVFEINGRFSGTTPFRMHAGFNEVEHVLRRLVLGQRPPTPEIHPKVILRHWEETVLNPDQILGGDR